jgi:hypothetical protein
MLRYDRHMNRYAWIALCLAAFSGLFAPLCSFACSEAGSTAIIAVDQGHAEDPAPCHGGNTTPAEPSPTHERDCSCNTIQLLLTSSDTQRGPLSLITAAPFVAVLSVPSQRAFAELSWLTNRRNRLPQPDILLLKSTLLI